MKWAVKIRYLGYDNKWHRHTTKWYQNSSDAWEEAERFAKHQINYLEMASAIAHK